MSENCRKSAKTTEASLKSGIFRTWNLDLAKTAGAKTAGIFRTCGEISSDQYHLVRKLPAFFAPSKTVMIFVLGAKNAGSFRTYGTISSNLYRVSVYKSI